MIRRDGEGELEIAVHEVEPPTSARPGDFRATVRVSTLVRAGFRIVAHRVPPRPIGRHHLTAM